MFSTPESGKISDRWTCVEIKGGEELDEEGRAFMQRYGLRGYPSLLAVTAGGALIDRDLQDGRMRTAEYLYQAMEQADEVNRGFLELKAKLSAEDDAASKEKLADLLADRLDFEPAAELYEAAYAEAPGEALVQKRLILLARLGDREAEEALLDEVIEQFPDAKEHMGWRMRRATIHIVAPTDPSEQGENARLHAAALEPLRAELAEAEDAEGEATVRIAIARLQHGLGEVDESQANLDWVFEHAPGGRAARIAYLTLAQRALEKRDTEQAKEHAGKVLEQAPKSEEAAQAHMLLGDVAYGDHDLDAMETHFKAVVELAPGTAMADVAKNVLDSIQRRRDRDGN